VSNWFLWSNIDTERISPQVLNSDSAETSSRCRYRKTTNLAEELKFKWSKT